MPRLAQAGIIGVWWFAQDMLAVFGARTSRLVDIFGLELKTGRISKAGVRDRLGARIQLTLPEMGPSWADLPFTVKVTPLGALDLTSRLARRESWLARCAQNNTIDK